MRMRTSLRSSPLDHGTGAPHDAPARPRRHADCGRPVPLPGLGPPCQKSRSPHSRSLRSIRGAEPVAPGAAMVASSGAAAAPAAGAGGYHEVTIEGIAPGARYKLRLDGREERPDPASRLQPQGVHGASEIVGRDFAWKDGQWRGLALKDYVIYELHVGTFTNEGTFDAIIGRLDELRELGVTAIQLLPIAQFPGTR